MPVRAVYRKVSRIRSRFGATAPRVVVRGHFPWYWSVALLAVSVSLIFAAGWLLLRLNGTLDSRDELALLREQVRLQQEELTGLRSVVGTGDSVLSIERATQQQLVGKIRNLEGENSALKEDLLLFERIVSVPTEEAVVRIEAFRVFHDDESRYRYRLVLAFRPNKASPDFRGRFQLAVSYSAGGSEHTLVLPDPVSSSGFPVELKHFSRREGGFELPVGSVLIAVEARVLQGDLLRARRSAAL
jgi:hypothetical protein